MTASLGLGFCRKQKCGPVSSQKKIVAMQKRSARSLLRGGLLKESLLWPGRLRNRCASASSPSCAGLGAQLVVAERFSRATSDGFDAYYAHADFVPASSWMQDPVVGDRVAVCFILSAISPQPARSQLRQEAEEHGSQIGQREKK